MSPRPLAALCLLALAPPARAGVVMEMRIGKEKERPSRMLLDATHLRMEVDAGEGKVQVTLFDATTRTLTQVNEAERTYSQVNAEELRKAMGAAKAKARAAIAQARAQLDRMPPEQRKQVEAALAQAEAQAAEDKPPKAVRHPQWRFEKTGKSGSAAGHACEWYRQFDGPEEEGEGCFTPLARLGLKVEDFAVFQGLVDLMDPGGSGRAGRETDFARILAQAPGFPVIAAATEDGKRVETMRVEKLAREAIPASAFAPPAGYRKVAMPGLGAPGDGE
jgi:hypothetical protein